MKKTTMRVIAVTLLLMAGGSTQVLMDGTVPLPPYCPPKAVCD